MSFHFDPKEHKYTCDGVVLPSVTQVLKSVGFSNNDFYTEEGLRRGRAVHAACQYLAEDDLEWGTVLPEYVGYVKAYAKFVQETSFKANCCEKPLMSEKYRFAGTPDQVGLFPADKKSVAIVEIKTGKSDVYAQLQTAGQEILVSENFGDALPYTRIVLELRENGGYTMFLCDNKDDKNHFLSALALYNRRNNGQ